MRQLLFALFVSSANALEERAHLRRAGAEGDSLLVDERVANDNSSNDNSSNDNSSNENSSTNATVMTRHMTEALQKLRESHETTRQLTHRGLDDGQNINDNAHALEPNSSIAAQKAAPQETRAEARGAPRNTTMNASDINGVVGSTSTAAGTACDTTPLAGTPNDYDAVKRRDTIDQLLHGGANASDWESYDSDVMWAHELECREPELRKEEMATAELRSCDGLFGMNCAEIMVRKKVGLIAYTTHKKSSPDFYRSFGCSIVHNIHLRFINDGQQPQEKLMAALDPNRHCKNVRNFRGNGPEDVRMVKGEDSEDVILLFPEYTRKSDCPTGFARVQHVRSVSMATRNFSEPFVLEVPKRECIEKNYMPFIYKEKFYIVRWVSGLRWGLATSDNEGEYTEIQEFQSLKHWGDDVLNQTNTSYEKLNSHKISEKEKRMRKVLHPVNTHRSDSSWLSKIYPTASLSGGTPFVPLNSTHYIGVGHQGKHVYACFFLVLEMETLSISAISNMFYVDQRKTVSDKRITNMPMSIHVHEKPVLSVRLSVGINDRTNAAVELKLDSFNWFTRDGTNRL